MSIADRIRIQEVKTLAHDWGELKKTTFDYRRNNGDWQRQTRETYNRGNGATILLYNVVQRTVILTRQFRFPCFVNGYPELLIETPAGLLDKQSPEERIRGEAEEETGFHVRAPQKIFEAYMSPGSVTEKLTYFIAAYEPSDKRSSGGGLAQEGEDIETLETPFDEALAMLADGRIVDGKTIILIQYAALRIFR